MTDSPADRQIHPTPKERVPSPPAGGYRVLARKYRPQRFSELIGQDVLVRSLANAIRTGRVAHAFLLTGIRGVGKTTTARLIARALNCTGPDGRGGPTPEPCGACDHCRAIAEDRHIDVLEMDAATRTGIDDIREIVDSVRYAPTSARFKMYIIDEVHMLSEKAFNGLLKTLEEPPPQAKFVFATTEVRKVPLTILSRCQRFDLRRVEAGRLFQHLSTVAGLEGLSVEPEALRLIARAAEGSVRDALSLLDQAAALGGGDGEADVSVAQVHAMLGLTDRARLFDLFEALMRGEVAAALDQLGELHDLGCEPEMVVHDLLELCHWLTRLKVAPEAAIGYGIAETDAARGRAMADGLALPVLARTWQMLLKGLDELRLAPDALRATEMLLVRLAYAADLPSPAELVAGLGGEGGGAPDDRSPVRSGGGPPRAAPVPGGAGVSAGNGAAPPDPAAAALPGGLEDVVRLFRERDQPMLASWLHDQVGLVHFAPGEIELCAEGGVPDDWPRRVAECLRRWTDRPWHVSMVDRPGAPPLGAQAAEARRARLEALAGDPRVRPVLETFPGARIVDIRRRGPDPAESPSDPTERS